MPQKQRKRSVYFCKTCGQPQCNEGADLAFGKEPVAVRNAHEVEVAAASTDRNHSM